MKYRLLIKPHDCSMQKIEPVACQLLRVTCTSTLTPPPDLLTGRGSSVSPLGFLLLESFTRSLGRDDGARTRTEPTTFNGRGYEEHPSSVPGPQTIPSPSSEASHTYAKHPG